MLKLYTTTCEMFDGYDISLHIRDHSRSFWDHEYELSGPVCHSRLTQRLRLLYFYVGTPCSFTRTF